VIAEGKAAGEKEQHREGVCPETDPKDAADADASGKTRTGQRGPDRADDLRQK
jgi:hypothetical protein